jgi:hypothetical protein
MYNLFAILADRQVARIGLAKDSQTSLKTIFDEQASALLDDDRERHPYAPAFIPTDGGIVVLKHKLPPSLSELSPTTPNHIATFTHQQVEALEAKAIVAVDPVADRYCFQFVERRNFLGPRRPVLLFGPNANELKELPGIVLGAKLDALHEDGKLYFTSETVVRRFLDLDVIFRASTNDEIREVFGSEKFIGFDEAAVLDPDVSDTWVRRKVMFIKQSNILDVKVGVLQEAAKLCKISLAVTKGKMRVPATKKELKILLKFLSEDFLESPIRPKTIFEVSSKRPHT